MTITYFGHSCFKLKGKRGTVVFDPYGPAVGFSLPAISADIVIVSHNHADHNNVAAVHTTARREKPFLITQAGEYEVGGISVFGTPSFHDNAEGAERGKNVIFTVLLDGIRVCHLGDIGHMITADQAEQIGGIDVLLCPVGGIFTIDSATAVKVIHQLEPAIVIPMHYKTSLHAVEFTDLQTLTSFTQEYGMEPAPISKLEVTDTQLPEETELVIMVESSVAS